VLAADIEVAFDRDEIRFLGYRYPAASVFPSGTVTAAQIRDADPTGTPPELRLLTGETLFVPSGHKDELRAFCERNERPLVERPDLWGALLEPFLDTLFTEHSDRYTRDLLTRHGLSPDEIAEIRARFEPAMVAYNIDSGLWDWCYLGLEDLLNALVGHLSGERHRLPPAEFADVYRWAMELADRPTGRS
jgi:hypothetical protein